MRNPITRPPGGAWEKKQLALATSGIMTPDPAQEVLLDEHIWPDGYLHLIVYRIGPDWYRWVFAERKEKKTLKVVGTGDATRLIKKGVARLEIGNSVIMRSYRGYGLYPIALRALKTASGLTLVSSDSRSKKAEASWKRLGGVKLENEDRYLLANPRLGNHGFEFKQRSALSALRDALVEEKGRDVPWDEVESLADISFQRILSIWQREQSKIFLVRDYPALRVKATVALAQFVASGGMHKTNPPRRRTTR